MGALRKLWLIDLFSLCLWLPLLSFELNLIFILLTSHVSDSAQIWYALLFLSDLLKRTRSFHWSWNVFIYLVGFLRGWRNWELFAEHKFSYSFEKIVWNKISWHLQFHCRREWLFIAKMMEVSVVNLHSHEKQPFQGTTTPTNETKKPKSIEKNSKATVFVNHGESFVDTRSQNSGWLQICWVKWNVF